MPIFYEHSFCSSGLTFWQRRAAIRGLKASKPFLYRPYQHAAPEGYVLFICFALGKAWQKKWITDKEADLAEAAIYFQLEGKSTLFRFFEEFLKLREHVNITYEGVYDYGYSILRDDWLNQLITHLEQRTTVYAYFSELGASLRKMFSRGPGKG